MKIGIVGFSGSGKTTLFNALTGQNAPTGYGGGKVNLGAIKVPPLMVPKSSTPETRSAFPLIPTKVTPSRKKRPLTLSSAASALSYLYSMLQ